MGDGGVAEIIHGMPVESCSDLILITVDLEDEEDRKSKRGLIQAT